MAVKFKKNQPESSSWNSLRAEASMVDSLSSSILVRISGGRATSDDATSAFRELGADVTDGNPSNLYKHLNLK